MRVSPRELKAVRAGGLVSRYAVLGDAVFVVADLPDGGTEGTAAEEPCRLEHWGLVLQGEVSLVGRRGRTFEAGMAFYIAPGPVHRFRADSRAVIAGFAPVTEPIDDSPATLSARGVEVLATVGPPPPRPTAMRIVGRRSHTVAGGEIETESAVMGGWLFTRSTFGRQSGYAESWCDLAHWGLVLDGSLVVHWEDGELELLGPGDAFHCPARSAGHRIEVADGATIVDYTPVSQLDDPTVRRAARALKAYAGGTHGSQRPAGSTRPRAVAVKDGAVTS